MDENIAVATSSIYCFLIGGNSMTQKLVSLITCTSHGLFTAGNYERQAVEATSGNNEPGNYHVN